MERIDRATLQIVVKSQADRRALNDVEKSLGETSKSVGKLQKEFDKLNKKEPNNKNSKKYAEWKKQIDGVSQSLASEKTRLSDLEKQKNTMINQMGVEKLTLAEVRNEMKQYKILLDNLNPNSQEYQKTLEYYQKLKQRLAEVNGIVGETKSSLRNFIEGFNQIGFAIKNVFGAYEQIVAWADQYVQSFAKMDEAMTDVMKYTGQTKREVEEMNETFSRMTTRTPREELNALAGAAGRLGITARKDIEGFVDAADKINVALGDDLGEGAIDQIGKLTMVFGEDKTKGLNGAMLATGSAINVLGANSSASTGFITEFTSAMAGMAVNARISQTDIMGYASALSQAGIEGQTASGVFAQMITKMFTDPAKFARAARLDVKQFTDLLKTDANQAILQFLNGLKQNGGFDSLAPALKSLSMQGTQAVPVISSLINKMDELKKAQQDARQAYDEGTSIIDEFNNANSSAAARLDIAKKALNDVSVELGQELMPIVEGSIKATTTLLRIITPIVSTITSNISAVVQLTAAIVAYNVATNASAVINSRFVASLKAATSDMRATAR